jgi:hypothetical protein
MGFWERAKKHTITQTVFWYLFDSTYQVLSHLVSEEIAERIPPGTYNSPQISLGALFLRFRQLAYLQEVH